MKKIINHSLLGLRETFKLKATPEGHLLRFDREPCLPLDILSCCVKPACGFTFLLDSLENTVYKRTHYLYINYIPINESIQFLQPVPKRYTCCLVRIQKCRDFSDYSLFLLIT